MSLWEAETRFLSLAPKVWHEGQRLHIRTSNAVRIATLFLRWREVVVDPQRRRIDIAIHTGWLGTARRAIPFDDVAHLAYRYRDIPTAWSLFHGRTDQIERYTIDAVLRSGEEVRLAAVTGEGSVSTGLGGVVFSDDDVLDARGAQQQESLALVDLLTRTLGVPLGDS